MDRYCLYGELLFCRFRDCSFDVINRQTTPPDKIGPEAATLMQRMKRRQS
jgi:hypothetical protein